MRSFPNGLGTKFVSTFSVKDGCRQEHYINTSFKFGGDNKVTVEIGIDSGENFMPMTIDEKVIAIEPLNAEGS